MHGIFFAKESQRGMVNHFRLRLSAGQGTFLKGHDHGRDRIWEANNRVV
jgi:hypothetical protein